jgi:acetyl esterase/lipase
MTKKNFITGRWSVPARLDGVRRGRLIAVICGLVVVSTVSSLLADDPLPPPSDDPYAEHQSLLHYVDADGVSHPVENADDWAIRRQHILEGMQRAMGPLPSRDDLPPFDLEVVEELELDGCIRRSVTFASGDGDRIPADIYLPTGVEGRRPAMLALHPTGVLGKRIISGHEAHPNMQYALELAQRGYVVIAPDYPSFGDYAYDFTTDAYASGTMKGIFNHMRCVDLLQSMDEVDPERIGVIGHSLGGHNSIFVAVFDERIKVVVTSCGWTPFHDYYEGEIAGWTSDRYMPRLKNIYDLDPDRVPFDFYELVAAIAPRAFFTSSPVDDDNFEVEGVRRAMPIAAEVFALYNAESQLLNAIPDCEHDFPSNVRGVAYDFIDEALQ